MSTMSIGGRSSNLRPDGLTRFGLPKPTGLASADHCGSVRMLTPASWIRSVEWPTQVTVVVAGLDRIMPRSLATTGRFAVLGWTLVAQMRERQKRSRTQPDASAYAGPVLANPRSR